jgi:hypothetical protein
LVLLSSEASSLPLRVTVTKLNSDYTADSSDQITDTQPAPHDQTQRKSARKLM